MIVSLFLGLLTLSFCADPYLLFYEDDAGCVADTGLELVIDNTYLTDGDCYNSVIGETGYESAITKCTGDTLDYIVSFAAADCAGPNTTVATVYDTCLPGGMKFTCAEPTIPTDVVVVTVHMGGSDCTDVRVEMGGSPTIIYSVLEAELGECLDNSSMTCNVLGTVMTQEDFLDEDCTVHADPAEALTMTQGCNTGTEIVAAMGGPIYITGDDWLCSIGDYAWWDLFKSYVYIGVGVGGGVIGTCIVLSVLSTVLACVCKLRKRAKVHIKH